MAVAIAIHNLPEGVVIGAAAANSTGIALHPSELALAAVIGLHDIPEGMAVSLPLIAGGMSKKRAVMTAALSGFPTLIGGIIGFSLGTLSERWLALSLSFASGAMLYVVFGETLPEAFSAQHSKTPAFAALVGILTGLAIIFH